MKQKMQRQHEYREEVTSQQADNEEEEEEEEVGTGILRVTSRARIES